MAENRKCFFCKETLEDEDGDSIFHWIYKKCWIHVRDHVEVEIIGIKYADYDTGCDNCNTDICRLDKQWHDEHECYWYTGPRLMENKPYSCKCCKYE